MAEKTNKKAGRGAGYYQAQRHRIAANKARRAARRARAWPRKGRPAVSVWPWLCDQLEKDIT